LSRDSSGAELRAKIPVNTTNTVTHRRKGVLPLPLLLSVPELVHHKGKAIRQPHSRHTGERWTEEQ